MCVIGFPGLHLGDKVYTVLGFFRFLHFSRGCGFMAVLFNRFSRWGAPGGDHSRV